MRRTQALVKRSSLAAAAGSQKGVSAGAGAAAAVSPQQRVFHSASDADLGRPMLETVGWPLVATVSMSMEDGDAKHARVALCMDGLRLGIHLSLLMGLDTLRYAFLTSLVRWVYHQPLHSSPLSGQWLRVHPCQGWLATSHFRMASWSGL